MENPRLAGLSYRVERIESQILSRTIQAVWHAAAPGRGMPLWAAVPRPDPHRPLVLHEASASDIAQNAQGDLIRVFDREGNVVWHREFRRREDGVRKHKEMMDDLLGMEVPAFRQKYGIVPERPSAVDAAGETFTPPAEHDPWAGLPQPRRNLLDD